MQVGATSASPFYAHCYVVVNPNKKKKKKNEHMAATRQTEVWQNFVRTGGYIKNLSFEFAASENQLGHSGTL